MDGIVKQIKDLQDETIHDEDENILELELNPPADEDSIKLFEEENGIRLPDALRELLLFSDGLYLFGLHILSLEEMEVTGGGDLVTFHNWGNGDFDCISLKNHPGAVMHYAHETGQVFNVKPDLRSWLAGAVEELKKQGALLHPMDHHAGTNGMYKDLS